MATQQTGTPPNTRRLGIFPHPFRLFVIIFVLILAVIAGIIGIQQAWGSLSNILAVIFGAVSVILGILTFWPSTKANEASALVSPIIPQSSPPFQINNYINQGQQPATQNFHSPVTDNANNSADNSQQTSSNISGVQTPVTSTPAPSQPIQRNERANGEGSAPSQSGASTTDHPLKLPATPFDATHRGSGMNLSGKECDDLAKALHAAYPIQEDFEIMLKVNLDKNLNTLVDNAHNYLNLIFRLIEATEAQGWTSDLVIAAYEYRPRNPELQKWQLKYAAVKETARVTNTPTANNIGPELKQMTQPPPRIAEISKNDQTMTSDEKQRDQQEINASLVLGAQKKQESSQAPISDQPLEYACRSIRKVYIAVQQSKVIFEGRGDIQQAHYLQATTTLHQVASYVQSLYILVQTVSPLPVHLERERLIMDLRHMSTEIRESIERIEHYGTLNAHLRERYRKDTEIRLSTILSHLDDLSRHIMNGPL